MMREKINIYRQFAQNLLGDAAGQFSAPFSNPVTTDYIDEALFLNVKRLFSRDKIKRETFAMQFYTSAAIDSTTPGYPPYTNLNTTSISGSEIFTDVGSQSELSYGGEVGNISFSTDTNRKVGLVFYDQGIVVLDAKKIMSGSQHVSGAISSVGSTSGLSVIGSDNSNAKFIPDLFVSASIDDIVNHFATTRFSSGSNTAITFQNNTNINSTLVFCRATADEFNYSSNPTFTDTNGGIVVIDDPTVDRTFSFVTAVGLYDANDNLLAVAKMSRPIEKNDEKDITFRVRLDF
jgi:hypothetical protein